MGLWLRLRNRLLPADRVLHRVTLHRWPRIPALTQVVELLRPQRTTRIGALDRPLLLLKRRRWRSWLRLIPQRVRLILRSGLRLLLRLDLLLTLPSTVRIALVITPKRRRIAIPLEPITLLIPAIPPLWALLIWRQNPGRGT